MLPCKIEFQTKDFQFDNPIEIDWLIEGSVNNKAVLEEMSSWSKAKLQRISEILYEELFCSTTYWPYAYDNIVSRSLSRGIAEMLQCSFIIWSNSARQKLTTKTSSHALLTNKKYGNFTNKKCNEAIQHSQNNIIIECDWLWNPSQGKETHRMQNKKHITQVCNLGLKAERARYS